VVLWCYNDVTVYAWFLVHGVYVLGVMLLQLVVWVVMM